MAFSLGGLFAAIGRAFPGYVQGRRQAIEDNWKDLQNFNQVQAGQQQNAWTEATWQPSLDSVYMSLAQQDMSNRNYGLGLAVAQGRFPAEMIKAWDETSLAAQGAHLPPGYGRITPEGDPWRDWYRQSAGYGMNPYAMPYGMPPYGTQPPQTQPAPQPGTAPNQSEQKPTNV